MQTHNNYYTIIKDNFNVKFTIANKVLSQYYHSIFLKVLKVMSLIASMSIIT